MSSNRSIKKKKIERKRSLPRRIRETKLKLHQKISATISYKLLQWLHLDSYLATLKSSTHVNFFETHDLLETLDSNTLALGACIHCHTLFSYNSHSSFPQLSNHCNHLHQDNCYTPTN